MASCPQDPLYKTKAFKCPGIYVHSCIETEYGLYFLATSFFKKINSVLAVAQRDDSISAAPGSRFDPQPSIVVKGSGIATTAV